jgi:hypothetical protein
MRPAAAIGQAAQAHGDGDRGAENVTKLAEVVAEGAEYDRVAAVVLAAESHLRRVAVHDLVERRQVGHQAEQDDVADDGRDRHRDEDAPRARKPGADRFLGHVGRGVVAGEGPLRLQ